jgi:hypothetical protein
MSLDMGDPTQQDPRSLPGEPATNEPPGDLRRVPTGADLEPRAMTGPSHEAMRHTSVVQDDNAAAGDDDNDLDSDDDTLDQATHEEMIENLLARVVVMRRRWAMAERERYELRRALQRVERERDEYRAEHERALRRAEAAELRLADVQARIAALEDSLQQRRRDRGGSAKLAGPRHDVGQDFK